MTLDTINMVYSEMTHRSTRDEIQWRYVGCWKLERFSFVALP